TSAPRSDETTTLHPVSTESEDQDDSAKSTAATQNPTVAMIHDLLATGRFVMIATVAAAGASAAPARTPAHPVTVHRAHSVRSRTESPALEAEGQVLRLTQREIEVVHRVLAGDNNREIAAKLHMSEHTVKHHLTAIFEKLGVTSRLGLFVVASELKL